MEINNCANNSNKRNTNKDNTNNIMTECLTIAIAGSRTITDYNALLSAISSAVAANVIVPAYSYKIVSGGAEGVDTLARRYAQERQLPLTELKPQYRTSYDLRAPLRRNLNIAQVADVLVAVWDGASTGTSHMITCMKELNKPYYIHYI